MGELRELVEQVWDAIELGDLDRLDALCCPDATFTTPAVGFAGIEAIKSAVATWTEAFPDLRHEVVDYVEADDKIAVELLITAMHTGPLATMSGDIAPSYNHVVIETTDLISTRNGKIATWHTYFDMALLLGQVEPVFRRSDRSVVAAGLTSE